MRLWIDTDVGTDPDDAFALLAAAGHPAVELVGVSTVDGDTEARAELARTLVDAPVAAGEGLTGAVLAAAPDAVLAMGPLTNMARLLRDGVAPPRLTVMGGVLHPTRHRGSVHEIEHNFGSDPDAAMAIVEADLRPLICPLDVTARMAVSSDDLGRFFAVAPILEEQCATWTGSPVCLHDPLAFLALVGDPGVSTRPARIIVDDGRLIEHAGGYECELVDDVEVAAATACILELITLAELPRR